MKTTNTFLLPLVSLVVILGVASWLDTWIEALRQSAFQISAGPLKWLIPTNVAHLLMAGLLLTLIWLFYKADSLLAAFIYTLAGLGCLFYLAAWIALPSTIPLPYLETLAPGTSTFFTSAMVAAMGLQKIIARGLASGRSRSG